MDRGAHVGEATSQTTEPPHSHVLRQAWTMLKVSTHVVLHVVVKPFPTPTGATRQQTLPSAQSPTSRQPSDEYSVPPVALVSHPAGAVHAYVGEPAAGWATQHTSPFAHVALPHVTPADVPAATQLPRMLASTGADVSCDGASGGLAS